MGTDVMTSVCQRTWVRELEIDGKEIEILL